MRYYEFINEAPAVKPAIPGLQGKTNSHAEKLTSFIEENCYKWLNEADNGKIIFYRGIQKVPTESPAFIREVRTNRRPRDSKPLAHKVYNLLIDMVGGKANRENAYFAIANEHDAGNYGSAYVILPIGEYSYTWSSSWADWHVGSYDDLEGYLGRYLKNPHMVHEKAEEIARAKIHNKVEWMKEKMAVTTDEKVRASYEFGINYMHSREVLEDTVSDVLHDRSHQLYTQVYMNPENYRQEKIKEIIKVDEGLAQCANNQHELMVTCNTALYVDVDLYHGVRQLMRGEDPGLDQ